MVKNIAKFSILLKRHVLTYHSWLILEQVSCIKRCQGGATQVCKKYTIKNNLKQKVEEEGTIGKEN